MSRAAARLASRLESLEHFGVKLGLERIEGLLGALGEPQRDLPVVLVAGTNGKGSTATTLASIVTAAGYRSGLYTSPHLESVEERIRLDGVEIETAVLADLVDEVVEAAASHGGEGPTYFETMTAAALCGFRRAGVEMAVLEVGMGGRLDATNVCQPLLSLITSIGMDHQRQLGETTAAIAREKAGILRSERPALAVVGDVAAHRALEDRAAEIGARLETLSIEAHLAKRVANPPWGQYLEVETERARYRLETRLEGRHQVDNIVLAVAAAERVSELGWSRIDVRAIERGVAAMRWPGRLEWVDVPSGPNVLLDAAHNAAGWRRLDEYLGELARPYDLLFGVLRDKVSADGTARLMKGAERVVLTTPPSERALPAGDLAATIDRPAEILDHPGEALAEALDTDRLLVVCGSLYLIGAVRSELRRKFGRPARARRLFAG